MYLSSVCKAPQGNQINPRPRSHPRGFALIATISVMVLMVMIALAMLSLSSIELRQSNTEKHQQIARANARMAVMLALGELQKYAGRDDRATAPSETLLNYGADRPPRFQGDWVGVYKTRDTSRADHQPVVGWHESPKYLTDLRSGSEDFAQNKLFLSWLVSHPANASADPSNLTAESITMVGKGTTDKDNTISVPLVPTTKDGSYAYWVGDNSTKALVNRQTKIPEDKSSIESLRQLQVASTSDLKQLKDTEGKILFTSVDPIADTDWNKVITHDTLSQLLLSGDVQSSLASNRQVWSGVTIQSAGLLTNPIRGGFKKDLTAFFETSLTDQSIQPSETYRKDGIDGQQSMIPGAAHLKTGPKWDALRRHSLIHRQIPDAAQVTLDLENTRLDGDSSKKSLIASQRLLGDYQSVEMGGNLPDLTKTDRQNIQPILAEANLAWNFSRYQSSGTDPTKAKVRLHIYPSAKLWNPYNVSIKTPPYVLMIACFGDADIPTGVGTPPKGQVIPVRMDRSSKVQDSIRDYLGVHRAGSSIKAEDAADNRRFLGFYIEPMTLSPGQCVVCSADPSRGVDSLGATNGKSSSRYRYNFKQNPMSAKVQPGETSFYFDIKDASVTYKNAEGEELDINYRFNIYDAVWIGKRGAMESFILKADMSSVTTVTEKVINASSADQFPTVSYINTNNGGLYKVPRKGLSPKRDRYHWGYLFMNSSVPGNPNPNQRLTDFDNLGVPPRFWRVGTRFNSYNEFGGAGNDAPMDLFSSAFQRNKGAPNLTVASWNLRAPLSTSSWGSSGSWGSATGNGLHARPPVFPLLDGSNSAPPTIGDNQYFIANPLVQGEGRNGEPAAEDKVVLFEIPRIQPLSLGEFAHAQLSYSPWHPSYIIGHGLATGRTDSDATIIRSSNASSVLTDTFQSQESDERWTKVSLKLGAPSSSRRDQQSSLAWFIQDPSISQSNPSTKNLPEFPSDPGFSSQTSTQDNEILIYDMPYEVNSSLWDHYYLSGQAFSKVGTPAALPEKGESFPSGQLVRISDSLGSTPTPTEMFHELAPELFCRGAFNVNSTSVNAWKAVLGGLRDRVRTSANNETSKAGDSHPFSPMLFPGIEVGDAAEKNTDPQVLAGFRALTDDELEELSEAIVDQVKLRGPFLSLADFVNRRLVSSGGSGRPAPGTYESTALVSALEAAIESTSINDKIGHSDDDDDNASTADSRLIDPFQSWFDREQAPQYKTQGMPGYLSQKDLLVPLAPLLTARGDTFTIRGYGDSRDSSGKILAKAWCEIVVQRTAEYIGDDDPLEPILIQDGTSYQENGQLSDLSKKFGRRFKIIQFKWLNPDEV